MLETARFVETADAEPRELFEKLDVLAEREPAYALDVAPAEPRELFAKLDVAEEREPAYALEVAPPRAAVAELGPPLRPKYGIELLRLPAAEE
ncbi:MAG: hypothetical protein WA211_19450 [Candidatus Acidiferrales bacterium]